MKKLRDYLPRISFFRGNSERSNDLESAIEDLDKTTPGYDITVPYSDNTDFTVTGYDPQDLSQFENLTFVKNGGESGVYLIGPRGLRDRYVITSWDESKEESREDKTKIQVDGKEIALAGLIEPEKYSEFEDRFREAPTLENAIKLMSRECYSPNDKRNKNGTKQVLVYALRDNPKKLIRRAIKGTKKIR